MLERLCNAVAVSGDEGEVRRIVLEAVTPHADEVRVDALGNVLAVKRGSGNRRPRVMLDAHMDEVGFMIVADDGKGYFQFQVIGGIRPSHLLGKHVIAGKDHQLGVIGTKPVHLSSQDERKRNVEVESLRIDLGPDGQVTIGDRATFATRFRRAGGSIMAKSVDDRIGVAILLDLVSNSPPNIDLCAAFTVQEEIGLRGAGVAARFFSPDLAIAIDAASANDLPSRDGAENVAYDCRLGSGPAIYIAGRRDLSDARLVRFLQHAADVEGIPHQFRQAAPGWTDASAIQESLAGVPSVSVSVPVRYPHSPISIARVTDWMNTLRLLETALQRITRTVVAPSTRRASQ